MTAEVCPRCRVWEGGYGPPSPCALDVFTVYAALTDYYSKDPGVLEDSSDAVAHRLTRLGYLNHAPDMVDVESCLAIIREVERL